MPILVFLRWLAFVTYIGLFFIFPLGVLWDVPGMVLGSMLTIGVLIEIYRQGTEKILARMHAEFLSTAEAPEISGMLKEYARRLSIPVPKLAIIESPAVNFAVLGFTRNSSCLVLTRGAIDRLSREQLSSVLGREITQLWHKETFTATWLSSFLSFVDFLSRAAVTGRLPNRTQSFKVFLRQAVFFPISLFPIYVLGRANDPKLIDSLSTKLSRLPRELSETLRMMEALQNRIPLQIPFSTRHLFLQEPKSHDSLVGIFFQSESLNSRIRAIELLSHVAIPS